MTIENLATIEDVRKYHFDPKEVIKGLNGYYESDKRNGYITVKRNDVEGPAYLSTILWLSALIEWLREDHDIFYYPGMDIRDSGGPGLIFDQVEAARNAAKMCGLRAHIKDELGMRDLWFDKNADILELVDTLFRALDCCDETINRLTRPWNDECKDIMNYIRHEASRNGFDLPEEIDGGALTIKRVFHDLLELLGKKEAQRKAVNEQRWEDLRDIYKALGCDGMNGHIDDFAKAVKARAEYIESLSRIAKQEVDDYKLSLKDYILHDIKEHGYRYNGLETKSIEEIVDWIITMATCANKTVEDVQKETKRKCYWYLWNALKKLSPECDALKIDCYEELVDLIFYEISLINGNCKQCQRKHSIEKFDYIRRANKAEEELKKLRSANEANNDVIKKLRELLNEINKEEDGE